MICNIMYEWTIGVVLRHYRSFSDYLLAWLVLTSTSPDWEDSSADKTLTADNLSTKSHAQKFR